MYVVHSHGLLAIELPVRKQRETETWKPTRGTSLVTLFSEPLYIRKRGHWTRVRPTDYRLGPWVNAHGPRGSLLQWFLLAVRRLRRRLLCHHLDAVEMAAVSAARQCWSSLLRLSRHLPSWYPRMPSPTSTRPAPSVTRLKVIAWFLF